MQLKVRTGPFHCAIELKYEKATIFPNTAFINEPILKKIDDKLH
jgi:hypothetical protein